MSTRIIFYPAISLDGFIADPDGDSSWVTEEDEQLFVQEVQKAGCVIVGSTTFKQYEGVIYPIDETTTFVCTSQYHVSQAPASKGVVFVGGEISDIVDRIEAFGFSSAVLSGGAQTNGRFAEAGAIDEMIISIYPHVLGEGLRLFGTWEPSLFLELLDTKRLGEGVIQNRYNVRRN